ncbi:MAG: phage tail tape measure protein [Clostridium sp.]|nr:phage tail tape measure protein [Clostridium sp.]
MAGLKVRFSLIDEMSDRLTSMADCGRNMIGQWESAKNSLSTAMETAASGASNVVSSLNNTANSFNSVSNAANTALSGTSDFSDSMNRIGNSANEAVSSVDNWTAAAQNYDKSALEAVYTTEQLVQMGLKSADALYTETDVFNQCEQAASKLNSEIENAVSFHEELSSAFEQASSKMEAYADSGVISAEMQSELETANKATVQAIQELETAQNQAKAAMENYDNVIISGTTNTAELEAAQNQAAQASANLTAAEDNAKKAVEDFSKASDEAGKSADESSKKGIDAIEALAGTVIASKIADEVRDIAKSAYELADAFSEAEKVVVNATGATGEALDGLEQSMMNAYSGHHQDLNTTAGAIGEINTRMALTGDKLTDVTGLFLDYAAITGSDVVGSVQNVTKVMNQWGVEADSVESILDRLAYAGQISGISVDNLSNTLISGAASFQEVGLSLDSAIQLLADFELAGINSSTAITAMRTAVNNFTNDGKNAETELQNVINKIASMENSTEATALAVDTFGARAGQQLASAIRNGIVSIDSFNTSLESADGTLRNTAEAGETLGEKWDKFDPEQAVAFANELSGMDSASAAAKVSELNQAFGELADVKDKTTNSLADIQEEYTKKLDEINKNMQADVKKLAETMEFPKDAVMSAQNTLNAYAREITQCGESAVTAAQNIADRVSVVLASASATINVDVSASGSVYGPKVYEADAAGTTNSADVFIAGEEGPELIVGKAGSTVFPTSETNRIISAVSDLGGRDYTNLMAENSTEFSTFNSNQNTEIINNYSSVQGVGYDDTKVVSLLEKMDSAFTDMERKIVSTDTSYTVPDMINTEPIGVIVDLSLLDGIISKFEDVFNSYPSLRIQNDDDRITSEDASSYRYSESSEYSETVSKKEFTININGGEPIVVKSNDSISKEDVLEIVVDNLKPALASIISVEKLEEGDSSYDY